jgi:hypothetical protein
MKSNRNENLTKALPHHKQHIPATSLTWQYVHIGNRINNSLHNEKGKLETWK